MIETEPGRLGRASSYSLIQFSMFGAVQYVM